MVCHETRRGVGVGVREVDDRVGAHLAYSKLLRFSPVYSKPIRVDRVTSNDVDHALTLATELVGQRLLETGEDQWYDRKSARIAPGKLAEVLVAFANAEGGTVVIGLSKGVVEGIDNIRNKWKVSITSGTN